VIDYIAFTVETKLLITLNYDIKRFLFLILYKFYCLHTNK